MIPEKCLEKFAEKRSAEKRGFFVHFAIFIIVNLFISIQWWVITGGEGFPWFIITLGGWGIGIVAHYIVVFKKVEDYQKLLEGKK